MPRFSPIIVKITTLTMIFIGAFAVSVLAMGVYTDNPCPPPQCNVAAPINASAYSQYKQGFLGIQTSAVPSTDPIHFEVNGSGLFTGLNIVTALFTNSLRVSGGPNVTNKKAVLANKEINPGVADGTTEWKDPATLGLGDGSKYTYISPIQVFGINSGNVTMPWASNPVEGYPTNWIWSNPIPYPGIVPSTAKAVILRVNAQANYWDVKVYIKQDSTFSPVPKLEVAHAYAPNNNDDAASDSVVISIPYATEKAFQATWYVPYLSNISYRRKANACGVENPLEENCGNRADIYVIGYTE